MAAISCSFCRHPNAEHAKFCSECGSPLHLAACDACGAVHERAATRCWRCDAPLPAAAVDATAARAVVEPFPQPVPEPFPVPEPEPFAVPEPEPHPQPVPEPYPRPVPEPYPQPVPEPYPQPVPEPLPQPEPEPLPGSDPQVRVRRTEGDATPVRVALAHPPGPAVVANDGAAEVDAGGPRFVVSELCTGDDPSRAVGVPRVRTRVARPLALGAVLGAAIAVAALAWLDVRPRDWIAAADDAPRASGAASGERQQEPALPARTDDVVDAPAAFTGGAPAPPSDPGQQGFPTRTTPADAAPATTNEGDARTDATAAPGASADAGTSPAAASTHVPSKGPRNGAEPTRARPSAERSVEPSTVLGGAKLPTPDEARRLAESARTPPSQPPPGYDAARETRPAEVAAPASAFVPAAPAAGSQPTPSIADTPTNPSPETTQNATRAEQPPMPRYLGPCTAAAHTAGLCGNDATR